MSIIHVFLRWVLGAFWPGTGKRRAISRAVEPALACRSEVPRAGAPWPPVRRSPYGCDVPLDGGATTLVRPYVVACEREQVWQYRRRIALVLAADFGIDLDPYVVGAEWVA
ncbi:hypothetical protein [Streptomyces sp. NPDC050704]|uniref:hypothetical protein n=1 Tax=Streptomyces sp. NPDC050704 TaxID=3157219 RepID=UPI003439EE75